MPQQPTDLFRWEALVNVRDTLNSAIAWRGFPNDKKSAHELRKLLDWMRNEQAQANLEVLIHNLESTD